MKEKLNEINTLINIVENSSNELLDTEKDLCENFKRKYIFFLKLTYDRLREEELRILSYGETDLGLYKLGFGTDEFIYDYKLYSEILASIDIARGIPLSPEKYKNPLIDFREMFYDFFKILKQPFNSEEALEIFGDLTKQCLERLGFNDVETMPYYGSMIIEVDLCTRISKLVKDLYKEQAEFKKHNPNAYFITDDYTIQNYVKPRLENWDYNDNNINKKVLKYNEKIANK